MAKFTVRIELHKEHKVYDHPNHPVYSFLTHGMEAIGFSRIIDTGGLKELPRAEYTINGEFTCPQLLRAVKKVCETTDRDFAIVISKTVESMYLGLRPVTGVLKISRTTLEEKKAKIAEGEEEIPALPTTVVMTPEREKQSGIIRLPERLEKITANIERTRACLDGIQDVVRKNRAVLSQTRAIMESTRIDNPLFYYPQSENWNG